jgi:hypothetical protein
MIDASVVMIKVVQDKKFINSCSDIEIVSLETQIELARIAVNKEKIKRGLD